MAKQAPSDWRRINAITEFLNPTYGSREYHLVRRARQEGISMAAAFIAEWDGYVDHDFRLSDCLLGKFNMLAKSKIRKNRSRKAIRVT